MRLGACKASLAFKVGGGGTCISKYCMLAMSIPNLGKLSTATTRVLLHTNVDTWITPSLGIVDDHARKTAKSRAFKLAQLRSQKLDSSPEAET